MPVRGLIVFGVCEQCEERRGRRRRKRREKTCFPRKIFHASRPLSYSVSKMYPILIFHPTIFDRTSIYLFIAMRA